MTDSEHTDRGEMRMQMVENVQNSIQSDRNTARSFRQVLKRNNPSDPGNVLPTLTGIEVGLGLASDAVEQLNGEIMFGEGMPAYYDPREVADEAVSEVLRDIVSEANSENWGNVAANLDRLQERCDELRDGEGDE
ncbi:hypothetical protein [Haloarcula amylovorans]|uniref:hypothetical protein n=1 Tax=Haloarcula amylovorans TaxID=2562280 RepID=UPI001076B18D|nr:hypothetical protein [Halomicroarcula amylolytica]